jgi:glutamate synthase (NADPH/NADH) small chain
MADSKFRIPEQRSETRFDDYKRALSDTQAVAEANRCLYCNDAPCIAACPTSIDIPEFIRKIATGNLKGSARTIFSSNIMGMSCARVCPVEVLCAGACVYNELHSPAIQIGKLQRYATDAALARGWRFFEAGPDTGKSVGLIGGGPSSLSAAHALRRLGHGCTIYEQRNLLGGLNTWGVAPYKLRADRALEEVEWLLGIGGIEVKTGGAVGADISWEQLEQRHDALFLGMGIGQDQWLRLPGADLPGVEGAVAFIERIKTGEVPVDSIGRALIIGGGNTAVDSVREALGLGVPEVVMVYRRTEKEMSGYQHEWAVAKVAGAKVEWRSVPVAFEGDGKVERVRCVRLDEGRNPIPGSDFVLQADLVLMAIGQSKIFELLKDIEGIQIEGGRIVVDEEGRTGRPGLFAGGDCTNGGKEVVNAVAEGAAAARGIDRFLSEVHDG